MTLFLISAVMLLIRAFVLVLLGLVSRSAVFLYIGADIGLFLLVKIVRDDFFYWIPLHGFWEIVMSILGRVVGKVVLDFTSLGETIYEID